MHASRLIDGLQTVEDDYHRLATRAYAGNAVRDAYGAAKVWAVSPSPPETEKAYGYSAVALSGGDLTTWNYSILVGEAHKTLQTRTQRRTLLEFLEGRLEWLIRQIRAGKAWGAQATVTEYPQVDYLPDTPTMIATLAVRLPRTVA